MRSMELKRGIDGANASLLRSLFSERAQQVLLKGKLHAFANLRLRQKADASTYTGEIQGTHGILG